MNAIQSRGPRRPRRPQESRESRQPKDPNRPITPKQAKLLIDLGKNVNELAGMTCAQAREELSERFAKRRAEREAAKSEDRPASDKQVRLLLRLGAPAGALTTLSSREASAEIQRLLRERGADEDPGPHSPMLASAPSGNPWRNYVIVEREDGSVKLRFLGDRPQKI